MKKLIWVLLSACLVLGTAEASRYGDTIINNFFEDNGVNSSDLDSLFASSLAVSQIHCNTSSRKHQAGFGTGYANGKNAFAGGYCHSIGSSDDYSMTLGGTCAVANGQKPGCGLGFNIAW